MESNDLRELLNKIENLSAKAALAKLEADRLTAERDQASRANGATAKALGATHSALSDEIAELKALNREKHHKILSLEAKIAKLEADKLIAERAQWRCVKCGEADERGT